MNSLKILQNVKFTLFSSILLNFMLTNYIFIYKQMLYSLGRCNLIIGYAVTNDIISNRNPFWSLFETDLESKKTSGLF